MKRVLSATLAFILLISMLPINLVANAATTSSYSPYAKIEYGYSASVQYGTIRYISQISSSSYFMSDYWGAWASQAGIECGTASISMALSYIGINKTPEDILDAGNGTTYFGSNWGGATAKSYSASSANLQTVINNYINGNGKYSPPTIHLDNYSSAGHFVILIGQVSSNVYQVLDPGNSSRWNITINGTTATYTHPKTGSSITDTIDRSGRSDDMYQYYNANASISNTYTITFNSNGGSGSMSSQTVNFGDTLTLPTNSFTRSGYVFTGWNAKRSDNTWFVKGQGWLTESEISAGGYTKRLYSNGWSGTFDNSWTSGASNPSFTLYAQWEKDTSIVDYSVNFLYNFSGKNYLYGSDFSSLDTNYWLSRDTSATTLSVDSSTKHNGYNSLKIVNTAAGSSAKDMGFVTLTNGNVNNNGCVPDNKSMVLSFWAKASVAGTRFYVRWAYEGLDEYRNVELTTEWCYYTIRMDKDDVCGKTLHPYIDTVGTVWMSEIQLEDGTSATEFVPETGLIYSTRNQTSSSNYSMPVDPERTGYTFDGWYTANQGGTKITSSTAVKDGHLNLYAHWTASQYTVTFDANGGNGAPDSQSAEINVTMTLSEIVPTRFGYSFLGWAKTPDATTYDYWPGKTLCADGDITLYAVWESAVSIPSNVTSSAYSAQINFADGYKYYSFTPSFSGRVRFESTGDGDTMAYLYDTNGSQLTYNDDGDDLNFQLTYSVTAGTKYYVMVRHYGYNTGNIDFTVKRIYDVTYDANGGYDAPGVQRKVHNVDLVLSSTIPVREGYIFLGWAVNNPDGEVAYQPGDILTENGTLTLFAVWEEAECQHSYIATVTAPTCTEQGYTTYVCSSCGNGYTSDYVDAKGHTIVTDTAVEATCTTSGLTEGSHCSVCNAVLVAQETIAAKGHTEVADKAVEATCTTPGKTAGSHCSVCNVVLTAQEVIPAKGHDYDAVVVDSTCTESGYTVSTCSVCGDSYTDRYIAALGHNFGDWSVVRDATCTEDGEEARSCETCGDEETQSIDAIGHEYVDGVCENCGDVITAEIAAPDVSVTNFSSSGKVKLSWEEVENAVSYDIYRALSEDDEYDHLDSVSGTSYTDTDAEAGTTYYYYVIAVDEDGNVSESSNIVSRTCDLARPVISLSGVESSGKIKVTWNEIDGAVKYQVYRSTTGKSGSWTLMKTTTGTSYTNTSAKAGTKYYYRVRAVAERSAANSAYSSYKYRTCDLPRPVISLSGMASSGKIKVTWEAIEGAISYKVYRATSKDGTYTLMKSTTSTSYTNTSAKAGTTYYYKVVAVHSKSSANSAYSTYKYRMCDLPRPDVSISLKNGKPRLTWDAIDGAVSYKVYRSTSKNGTYSLVKTTTGTSYTNTSAKSGTTYYYKVIAVHSKSSANSAYSLVDSIKSK